jgi:peptide/nickel transport system substrate-binding protein/microcin C transport system substrate-binding protein
MKFAPRFLALVLVAGLSSTVLAVSPNPSAPQGGIVNFNLGGEPPTLHPINSTDLYATRVKNYVLEGMLYHDIETYEYKPALAEKWEISKDNKTFTFTLRKNAVFHDGTKVTAEDVKFSFDAIFDPANQAAHLRPYYEGIAKVEVVDEYTVKATAKDTYFKNFDSIAMMPIFPKHVYGDAEKSKKMTRTLVGSGPYVLEKFDRGQVITLKKFDKWWGTNDKDWKGAYNFAKINFRFYKDETMYIERAKKGDLDYIDLRAESYVKKTDGPAWGKTVIKHKVENSSPKSYGFIAWNFRRELFQDRNVRVALAHLMNREEMNKKFRYGMADLATGPTYLKSEYASQNVKPFLYDPKQAQELLLKSGWKDTDKDGVLDKVVNGKKTDFHFTLLYGLKDNEKYWTMYKEDLKKAGIEMELKYLEWNSFLKLMDEGNFDAVALAWAGGDIDWDPKQIWHSSSAVPGGSNFIYYKNPEVDKAIDEARQTLDSQKRNKLLKGVYEKIAYDAPYAFLFNDKYDFYASSARMQMPAETFKYDIGRDYWWVKP